MSFTNFIATFWQDIAGWLLLLEVVVTIGTLLAVLHLKRELMSAIAWSLTVLLVPLLGALLFYVFGYQTVHRRLMKRRQQGRAYKRFTKRTDGERVEVPQRWDVLAKIGAVRLRV